MTLGELIGTARECKGWTLRELEKMSGVSNALISQIETGKVKDPGFSIVVRIVDALGITLDRAAKSERRRLGVLRKHIMEPKLDPRDPDPSREGIFRDHNCHRCANGRNPCVKGDPNRCDYPHARND